MQMMSLKALKSLFKTELKEMSEDKIKELRDERSEIYGRQTSFRQIKGIPQWFFVMINQEFEDEIAKIDRKIYYWTEIKTQRRKEKLFDIPFVLANCKIENYIEQKPRKSGNRLYYNCIFHNENTPSMKVENNRFYCFGCGKHGSVIDVVMHTHKMTFAEACRFLSNYGA